MIKFHCVIDIIFEAENIDDAFEKLCQHFKNVSESKLEYIGKMSIEKVKNEQIIL